MGYKRRNALGGILDLQPRRGRSHSLLAEVKEERT
jgi:hypothetical protein